MVPGQGELEDEPFCRPRPYEVPRDRMAGPVVGLHVSPCALCRRPVVAIRLDGVGLGVVR